jgi:hypothetical protein
MRDVLPAPLGVILLCLTFAVLAAECSPRLAHAQGEDVAVAQLCVHEAGWDSPADCDAIVAVLLNGAAREGMSTASFRRAYAPRFTAHSTPRSWVHRLGRAAHDPHAGIRWSRFRARWLHMMLRAGAALALPAVCNATDWSSPAHMRRRIAAGASLRVVDCGDTVNSFAVRGER